MSVAFLCDGNPAVGLGHLSRCLGLAEALRRQGMDCEFAGDFDGSAERMIGQAGFSTVGGPHTEQADAVVVDRYDITASRLQSMTSDGRSQSLTIIDDFARLEHYPESLIVNFTVRASEVRYVGERCRVLRGPQYFLVREAIRELYGRRPKSPPRRVLVSIGGYDRANLGPEVAGILGEANYQVELIAGGSRPHLAEEYGRADACITSGGLTKYEAAYVGLPVAALSQSPGEAADTAKFAGMGLCADLGFGSELRELRELILDFLADVRGHASMRAACQATFRQHSTDAVAAEIAESVPCGHR